MSENYNNHPSLTNWELVSINPNQKNWSWKTLFNLWANNIQSLMGFSLIASLFLVYNLNAWVVFLGTMLGGLFTVFMANLIGKPSQKMGIPFVVFLRTSMGIYGARYIGMLRGFVSIFMFGIQTFFIAKSVSFLIRIIIFYIDKNLMNNDFLNQFYLSLNVIDWFSLLITSIIQYYLFTKSIFFLKKIINFSGILVYLSMIFFLFFIFLNLKYELLVSFYSVFNFPQNIDYESLITLITVSGTMFAYFSIIIINFGDYSRNVNNEKNLIKGNYCLLLNIILFSIMAVLITVGMDIIFNKQFIKLDRILTNPNDIIGTFDKTNLTLIVLTFILIASIGTNLIANYIPSSYSLINFFPNKLTIKSTGFVISLLGFLIGGAWIAFISKMGFLSIIDTVASFLGPLFGIMIVDYYLIKKKTIIPKDLYSIDPKGEYFYTNGWNLKSLYSLSVAFIFSAVTIWNQEFRIFQPYSWIIGAFIGGFLQFLLSKK
tara:strand:- start:276 stop:1736 length:1461 start_codon:yes stop_codon:yes gene_type:complete